MTPTEQKAFDQMRQALKDIAEESYDKGAVECANHALTAANAVSEQPQAQGESYSERWYGSGEDRGWWIVRGGLVKREHVAFLGESVSSEEVSKVVAELNAAHPQATETAKRCWCETCRPLTIGDMRMIVCPDCGNKRCPKATHHHNACTNSNDIGQKGSSWEHVKPAAPEAKQ